MYRLAAYSSILLLSRTLFSFGAIASGALLALSLEETPFPSMVRWIWILLAFLLARSAGMALNAAIDAKIDAKNPRTSQRAVARGLLSQKEVAVFGLILLCFFSGICFYLGPALGPLSLFVSGLILLYPFCKRVSWICHSLLGLIQGAGPLMAYLAVGGKISLIPLSLGLALALWIAANDILYAFADLQVDREEGLFSLVARFGVPVARKVALGGHLLALCALCLLGHEARLSWVFYLGLLLIALLMTRLYWLLFCRKLGEMEAFAFSNYSFSLLLLFFLSTDCLWRVLF